MNSLERYIEQLNEIEAKFNGYKQDLDNIIFKVSSMVARIVITNGEIANPTPYYHERMGSKLNGKIIPSPIVSNDCMKYHYDSEDRLIMVEEYSVFLKKFQIRELYFYNELTERLRLSSGMLAVLSVFDNSFSNTKLSLAFAGRNGFIVEEFIYDGDVLTEIKITRSKAKPDSPTEEHKFVYENHKLIQIERICQNGYRELKYTTKKPSFNKIKEDTYKALKSTITDYTGNFTAFGIEGFVDQQQPMLCVCFTDENEPSDLIADWGAEMHDLQLYDWQFNDSQEKKCVKIIGEIIVQLVEEGLLKDKQIYFHQSQVCATQLYSGLKTVFKKANIVVN